MNFKGTLKVAKYDRSHGYIREKNAVKFGGKHRIATGNIAMT